MNRRKLSTHFPLIISMAAPMAGTRLITMLTYFMGMLIASHLGTQVIAACALINVSKVLTYVMGMSILFAVGVVAAQRFGAKDYSTIGAIFQQAILLSTIISLIIGLCFYYMDTILASLGQEKILMPAIKQFFHTAIWGILPEFLLVICQQTCFAIKKQRLVITCNIITFIFYLPVAYVFIHGIKLPHTATLFAGITFHSLGVKGLAYAFIFSSTFNLLILLCVMKSKKSFARYQLFSLHRHKGLQHVRKLAHIGWPMCVQFTGEVLIFTIIGLLIGQYGEDSLAAFQVVVQWQGLCIVPIFGISDAVSIIVGHAAGAKKLNDLNPILNATLILVGGLAAVVLLIYVSIPTLLAEIYGVPKSATQTLDLITVFFQYASIGLFLDALRDNIIGALRGLHDTQFAMWVSTLALYAITLPVGYLLVNHWGWGEQYYFLCYAFGFGLAIALLYPRWIKIVKIWQKRSPSSHLKRLSRTD
jgi:multidrug resistance protein, MATE family